MSQTTVNMSRLFAAAAVTAMTAAGLFASSAAAEAAACSQYRFNGSFVLRQDNGFVVHFKSTGSTAGGQADYVDSQQRRTLGTVNGSIQGRAVAFTIHWNGGAKGQYSGTVNEAGYANGVTVDPSGRRSAHWGATVPLSCAGMPKRIGRAPRIATVTGDVDAYDAPGGQGHVTGILRTGAQVTVVGSCAPNDWCRVKGTGVPGGDAWIWGHLSL